MYEKNIFISSIPKSGTHLLSSLIQSWSGGQVISVKKKVNTPDFDFLCYEHHKYLVGHYRFTDVKANKTLRKLFMDRTVLVTVRDPRDLCNSMLHYVLKSPKHQHIARNLVGLEYEAQIMLIANGITTEVGKVRIPTLNNWCKGFLELTNLFEDVHVLKYEDFFNTESIAPLIARVLSVGLEEASLLVNNALASGSKTKREGGARPYQWMELYSPGLKNYFENNFSDIISYLGYQV